MNNKDVTVVPAWTKCLLPTLILLILYLLDNPLVAALFSVGVYGYYIKPILWLGFAYYLWTMPRPRIKGKLRLRGSIGFWATVFAVIYIVAMVFGGFIDGFGKSPYDHSLRGLIMNFIFISIILVSRELFRSHTVNNICKKESYLIFTLLAIFMTVTDIGISSFLTVEDYPKLVEFAARELAPGFSQNLLVVYLAFLGGVIPAIIYIGITEGFYWFSPILPDLKWITMALIGTLCPLFCLMTMQSIYAKEAKLKVPKDQKTESPVGWALTAVFSIAMVWFSVGVFSIYPSVVATGSMEPMIKPGDVILVHRVKPQDLQIGDVIQFRRGNILISHRIIDIVEENQKTRQLPGYLTKGDNNTIEDKEPVRPEDVKGKVIQVIPKIGWPTLLFKNKDDVDLREVVF